jgi:hypothetical protein
LAAIGGRGGAMPPLCFFSQQWLLHEEEGACHAPLCVFLSQQWL